MRTFRYVIGPQTASMILTEPEQRSRTLITTAMTAIAHNIGEAFKPKLVDICNFDLATSFADEPRQRYEGEDLARLREEINEYVGDLVTTADQVDALRAEVYAWADEDDTMGELVLACLDTASVLRDLVADAFSKKEKEIAQEVKALVEGCRLRDWGVDEVCEHAGTEHPDARQIRRAFAKNPLWEISAGAYNGTLETLRLRTHYATPEAAIAGWARFYRLGYNPHVVEVEVDGTTHHLVYASAEEAERDIEGLSPDAAIVPMINNKEA